MTAWTNEVALIESIERHEGTDTLSIYTVLGYPVVDKTGKYNVGDLCCYIAIDSILPDTEQWHFLTPKAYERYEENGEMKQRVCGFKYGVGATPEKSRVVKAKKFYGVYSQGLLAPLPENSNLKVGDSVTELFQLKKVEEDEDGLVATKKVKQQNDFKPVGWSSPFYDIEGINKYLKCFQENEEVVLTEKIHGCSSSYRFDGEKLWIKSRNFFKKSEVTYVDGEGVTHTVEATDIWNQIARQYNLKEKLTNFTDYLFYGECYGQVGGFPYDSKKPNSCIRFFDVMDLKTMRFLDYDDFLKICKEAQLDVVPELYRGPWKGKEEMFHFAEGLTTLGGKHVREGFVVKTIKERFEPKLQSRMCVKCVGQGYNLQK